MGTVLEGNDCGVSSLRRCSGVDGDVSVIFRPEAESGHTGTGANPGAEAAAGSGGRTLTVCRKPGRANRSAPRTRTRKVRGPLAKAGTLPLALRKELLVRQGQGCY